MTISGSAAELLARASSRERVMPADARSGAVFERIVVGPIAITGVGDQPRAACARAESRRVSRISRERPQDLGRG